MGNLKAAVALAVGYWLFYAGIHDGGAYALTPWAAIQGVQGAVT